MRRVIFNQKGGVGKSSITANLAAISAARGLDTLVVDLDPQGNSSQYLLGDAWETAASDLAEFFNDSLSIRILPRDPLRYLTPTDYEGLHVLASSPHSPSCSPSSRRATRSSSSGSCCSSCQSSSTRSTSIRRPPSISTPCPR
jgi:cellulose biosynthesis protein BcsQ